jgi:hypothetical protein
MNPDDLEHRLPSALHRLADDVSASATDEARRAVRRQVTRLRRRQRTRRVVATGVLATAVIGSAFFLTTDRPSQVAVAPPAGDDLPTFTVDALGLEPLLAQDDEVWPQRVGGEYVQVYRPADDLLGPTLLIELHRATDTLSPDLEQHPRFRDAVDPGEDVPGMVPVEVRGRAAELWIDDPDSPYLTWNPEPMDDMVATARSWGVSGDELTELANDLEARPDGSGFEATELPEDLVEIDRARLPEDGGHHRVLYLTSERGLVVEIQMLVDEPSGFEQRRIDRLAASSSREEVMVLDQPALLTQDELLPGTWSAIWAPTDAVTVEVRITGADRAAVDEVLAGITPIDEAEWTAIVHQVEAQADDARQLLLLDLHTQIARLEAALDADPTNAQLQSDLDAKRTELADLEAELPPAELPPADD